MVTADARHTTKKRFSRRSDGQVVAGVAAGIADRLGIDPSYVRAAFVVLSFAGGVGVVAYLVAWAMTAASADSEPSGRELSSRQKLGLAALFVAALLVLREVGLWFSDAVVWPVALVAGGAAVAWDRSGRENRFIAWAFPGLEADVRPSTLKLLLGAGLTFVGLVLFAAGFEAFDQFGTVLLAVMITGVGLSLVVGPWVWRLLTDLRAERSDRIRSEERAVVAAHLHDSVLQTLALIQRTDDPRRMVTLARAQERELRSWLFERSDGEQAVHLKAALEAVATKIESDYDVPTDVVTVGDALMTERLEAMVNAAGEAAANAALHAQTERVTLYAETSPTTVDIYITDQGKGFDPELVDPDRHGIKESIVGRVRRLGGAATISSEVGEGTEVHLSMERS